MLPNIVALVNNPRLNFHISRTDRVLVKRELYVRKWVRQRDGDEKRIQSSGYIHLVFLFAQRNYCSFVTHFPHDFASDYARFENSATFICPLSLAGVLRGASVFYWFLPTMYSSLSCIRRFITPDTR